jgi:hypothetical protein
VASKFNDYLEEKLLVVVKEVNSGDKNILGALDSAITDPTQVIRTRRELMFGVLDLQIDAES